MAATNAPDPLYCGVDAARRKGDKSEPAEREKVAMIARAHTIRVGRRIPELAADHALTLQKLGQIRGTPDVVKLLGSVSQTATRAAVATVARSPSGVDREGFRK
jgi:hypothetical protein